MSALQNKITNKVRCYRCNPCCLCMLILRYCVSQCACPLQVRLLQLFAEWSPQLLYCSSSTCTKFSGSRCMQYYQISLTYSHSSKKPPLVAYPQTYTIQDSFFDL